MDLSLYKYKIEAHAHTSPASSCSEILPEDLVKTYKEAGVHAVCLTNHFMRNYLPIPKEKGLKKHLEDYYKTCEAGEKYGVKIILGLEMRFGLENTNDYLIYGIDEDFIYRAYDYFDSTLEQFYKEMKNDKNLIIQAHPFRKNMVLADKNYIDGIESFNMHPNHNGRIALAHQYAMKEPDFIVTAGSDYHHPGQHATGLILSKTLPENSFQFAELLKSKDYLFRLGGCVAVPYL